MSGVISREYEEVIHVDNEPSCCEKISERIIHELLKSHWEIGLAKEHNHQFKDSLVGNECSLSLVSIFDSNIVISPSYIKFGEDTGVFEFVDQFSEEGKGIGISNSMFIQVTVVLTGAEFSIPLLYEEEWGCLGRVGRANFPRFNVFI